MLVDDTDSGFLGADTDAFDVFRGFAHFLQLFVDNVGSLNSSLGVELGRERDLEKNVFHDIGSIGPLEFERFTLGTMNSDITVRDMSAYLEQDVIETPCLGGQD